MTRVGESVRPSTEPNYVDVRLSRCVPRCIWNEATRLAKAQRDKDVAEGRTDLGWTAFDILYQWGRIQLEGAVDVSTSGCDCSSCSYRRVVLARKDGAQ